MGKFGNFWKKLLKTPDRKENNTRTIRLTKMGKGYSTTSINTSIFRKDSLVTHNNCQYVSFYDKSGNVIIGKRETGAEKWKLKKTVLRGTTYDAHNAISMGVDGGGFLHVAYDMHNSRLKYARSDTPGSLKMIPIDFMDGVEEENVTYPEFHSLSTGELLFAYRSGRSGNGNMVLKIYNFKDKRWQTVQQLLIDGEGERNAYWQMYIGKNDSIHLSWVWRETSDASSNHDICYAMSPDKGLTWYKSDGSRYNLPITPKTSENAIKIPERSVLINQTSMCVDSSNNPVIATYWKNDNDLAPQYKVVWFDGNKWQAGPVYEKKIPFDIKGKGTKMIPVSRPCIICDDKKFYMLFRDIELGGKVMVAETEDLNSREWSLKELTTFEVDAWEPTFDTNLWKDKGKLDLFIQKTHQKDGDKKVTDSSKPTDIFVLEYRP